MRKVGDQWSPLVSVRGRTVLQGRRVLLRGDEGRTGGGGGVRGLQAQAAHQQGGLQEQGDTRQDRYHESRSGQTKVYVNIR